MAFDIYLVMVTIVMPVIGAGIVAALVFRHQRRKKAEQDKAKGV